MDHQEQLSIYEELVRCPICKQRFRVPRTLPCGHAFCEECLRSAISRSPVTGELKSEKESHTPRTEDDPYKVPNQNRRRSNHSKTKTIRTFPCPVCETDVVPRDPSKSISDWAEDFDTDDLTRRLLLALEVKEGSRPCEICNQGRSDLDPTTATCWCRNCCQSICDNCAEIHLRFKTSDMHYVIRGLEQLRTVSVGTLMPEPTCLTHERSLEFYCSSCSKSACYLCLKNEHKKCIGVNTIKEKATDCQEIGRCSLNEVDGRLREKEKDLQWILDHIEELRTKKNEIKDSVTRKTEELVKMLEEKASDFIHEAETAIEAEVTQFQDMVQSHEKEIHSLSRSKDFITEFLNSVSDADLISVSPEIEKILPQPEKSSDMSAVDIKADIDSEFIESFEKIQKLPLGQVVVSKVERFAEENPNHLYQNVVPLNSQLSNPSNDDLIRNERPILLSSFRTHQPEEGEEESLPSDVIITADGHVIVTDAKNIKVKKFTQQGQLVAQVSLASNPFCACLVDQDELAVTLPSNQKIAFLQVQDTSLSIQNYIQTHKKYMSIAPLNNNRFVCGSMTSKGIDVINQTGEILSNFSKFSKTADRIQCPLFLSVISEKAILISDLGTNSLVCCDLRGRVRFVYRGEGQYTLKYPRAVANDSKGFIYVADEKADTVYRFLPDGSMYDVLLSEVDELNHPFGLFATDNKLAVSEGITGIIKIYEIPIPF